MEENWQLVIHEKFEKARNLIDENEISEEEPFKAKYAARDILKEIKDILSNKIAEEERNDDDVPSKLKVMLHAINSLLGNLYVEVEEWSSGEEFLNSCLESLENYRLKPSCCLIMMGNYNQLGILWSHRNQPVKAKDYLCRAEKLYSEYQHETDEPPTTMRQLFSPKNQHSEELETGFVLLEKTHTITLYYLAQVYNALNDSAKSAMYCHITLKRQLKDGNYDPIDWSLNCATLSQYFLSKEQFSLARHHLACASFVIRQYEEKMLLENPDESDRMESLRNRKADIARCWAKYGVLLLTSSHEHLISLTEEENVQQNLPEEDDSGEKPHLLFPALEVTCLEEQVRDAYVLDFNDARGVFLNAKKWLEEAKSYYNLNDHASDYVEIEQELSKLYAALVKYEDDYDRQCRIHKRRIDLLESVLKELNPTYYLMVCRQLMFEIAETYSEMMEIKKTILRESNAEPTPHSLIKIKQLTTNSIHHYQNFIESVKAKETGKLPDKLADDVVRPTLVAHFYVARLLTKIADSNKSIALHNLTKALEYFKYVVDYLTNVPEHMELAKTEFEVCKEMVALLTMRIQRMSV